MNLFKLSYVKYLKLYIIKYLTTTKKNQFRKLEKTFVFCWLYQTISFDLERKIN